MQQGLVVEDQPRACTWLSQSLQVAFPGIAISHAATLAEGHAALEHRLPDIALIDLGLPDGSGIELIERLARQAPDCQSIVTTIFSDDVHLFPALRAGARGYLLKDQPQTGIVRALNRIVDGEPPLSPVIARRLLRVFCEEPAQSGSPDHRLTPREREVLGLIAKGYKLNSVAEQMNITVNTAASFVKSVYRKLKISSRAEATLEAARMGLIRTEL